MKKLFNFLLKNFSKIFGIGFSIFAIYKDLWGGGNPQNAIAWVAALLIWCLIAKTDSDIERSRAIKRRLDILARVLLSEFCKGNYAIKQYEEILKEEDITFNDLQEEDFPEKE